MSGDSWLAIMAICRDKVDGQTLQNFMKKANVGLRPPYDRVLLFAKPDDDVKAVLEAGSNSHAFESVEPLKSLQHDYKAISDFPSTYYKETYGINSNGDKITVSDLALIQLDQTAASKHGLCFVSVEASFQDVDPSQNEETIGFRCAFADVPAAIAALDDLTPTFPGPEGTRILRNEAVRCGGVWDPALMTRLHADEQSNMPHVLRAHLDLATYPPFRGKVSAEADPVNSPGVHPMVAVFITAEDVTVETVNELLEAAERAQSHSGGEIQRYAIVTDVGLESDSSTDGPAVPPLKALPALPRELLHASPEACGAFARSRFPAQKQLVDWGEFIVMDSISQSRKTVILGAYDGSHGLVLNRAAFGSLWAIQATVEVSPPSYDSSADKSSRADDGVDRYLYPWMQ